MTSEDQHAGQPAEGEEVFRTERLSVRRWRGADEPELLALYSIGEVIRWIEDGQALPASDAARWMEVTRNNYKTRGYGMFAIEDLHSAKTIGFGGLVHPGDQLDAEVKYAFSPEAWGQGLATEFVRGLLKYAKRVHRLTCVIATAAEGNSASKKVLIKSGFHQSGTRTEDDGSRTVMFEVRL